MDTSTRSQGGLTAEELKSQMYQTMQSTGVLHKLKGQLRQNMINELRGKQSKRQSQLKDKPLGSDLFAATIRNRNSKPWIQEVLDNLVLHHIKQSRYHYTLSLFQQESGLTNYSPAIMNELLSHLGLHPNDLEIEDISLSSNDSSAPHSSTPKQAVNRNALTLWRLLEKLANFSSKQMLDLEDKENISACDGVEDKQSTKPLTLSEKLKAIDDDMKSSYRRKYRDPNITVSTLASAIRRAEEDADRRTRIAFEEWKATELAKLRIEEARSSKQKVETRIRALEKEYDSRKMELANREKSAVDRLSTHRQQLEKELHEQRQSLLRELEQIRLREDSLQQKERFLDEMENVKMREIEMMKIQHEFASSKVERHPVLERMPSAVSTLADSLRHSQDGKQVITSKEMTEIVKEVQSKAIEAEQLKAQLASLQKELSTKRAQDEASLTAENKSLRNHLSQLEKEIQDVKLSQKSAASDTQAGAEAKDYGQTNGSYRRQQSQRQFELEKMVQEMHVALRESNQALLKATASSSQRDLPPAVSYPTLDVKSLRKSYFAPDVHFKEPLLSDRDIREYEPLDPTPLLPPKTALGDSSSTSLRFDISERLKRLDEESEMVSQEYDKYLRKNYREAVSPRNQPQTSKEVVDPEPPEFLSKSPERDLFPVKKTYFSDMAPAFLRDSPTLTNKRDTPGAKNEPMHKQTPERKTASQPSKRTKSPSLPLATEAQRGSYKEPDIDRQTLEREKAELPARLPALVVSKEVVPQERQELSASARSENSEVESRNSSVSWDEGSGKASEKSETSPTESKASSVSWEEQSNKVATSKDDPPSATSSDKTIPPQAKAESRNEKVTVSSLSTSTADDPLSLLSDGLGPDDQLSADKEMLSDEKVDADYVESVPQQRAPLSHYPFLQTQSPQREVTADLKPIVSNDVPVEDPRDVEESSSEKEETVDKDSLRLSMEDFEVESGGSSPKSKSSEEPHIDTVRRLAPLQDKETSERSPEKKKTSLPPIATQRKLPSLPPISGAQIPGSSSFSQPTPFRRANPPKDAEFSGRSVFTASVGSSSSDSLEVEEAIESASDASKGESRDASDPVFSLQKVPADLSGGMDPKKENSYEDSFEEDEKSSADESAKKLEESLSEFSSVSIDLPSGKSSQRSIPPIRQKRQIPQLTSFDDDAINAALKWGEDNQLKLESEDESHDYAPPPQSSPPKTDPGNKEEDWREDGSKMKDQNVEEIQEDVDVFEASASQISFESETSRKSNEKDDDDFW